MKLFDLFCFILLFFCNRAQREDTESKKKEDEKWLRDQQARIGQDIDGLRLLYTRVLCGLGSGTIAVVVAFLLEVEKVDYFGLLFAGLCLIAFSILISITLMSINLKTLNENPLFRGLEGPCYKNAYRQQEQHVGQLNLLLNMQSLMFFVGETLLIIYLGIRFF